MFYGDRIPAACSATAIAARAATDEAAGMSRVWSSEAARDPFLTLAFAAPATETIRLGTGIAVAYARSPYATALAAWDLQRFTDGRFDLGLATQVRPHIERRYGMPWPGGVGALSEYVACLRAIWHAFQTGEPPHFRSTHYEFTLMNPEFRPDPLPGQQRALTLWIAAVGKRSAHLAGEVAEGLHVHAFHTPGYLREVLIPSARAGRAAAGRTDGMDATCPVMAGIAHDSRQEEALRAGFRHTIAFYASTAAYLPVLQHSGLEDLHEPLKLLAREGRWSEMDRLIDDDVVDAFAVSDEPGALAARLSARYDGILTELALYRGGDRFATGDDMAVLIEALASAPADPLVSPPPTQMTGTI